MLMPKLIFDIETIGEDFDSLDHTSQESLTRWIKKDSETEKEYLRELEALKDGLGFSPFTGEVVAIGVLDYEKNKVVVTYQAPGEEGEEFEEDGVIYKAMSEADMLKNFWKGSEHYNEFVTFNGRCFDVPFLMVRSAVHKIKPTKDLMANRYLSSQRDAAKHVDLQDQMTFYGALRRKGGLHIISRAFGIPSPKESGIKGDDVGRLFTEKRYKDIARYNAGDLYATRDLYTYWKEYLHFPYEKYQY